MARLLLAILCCASFISLKAQPTTKAQFINNAADVALPGIDIYIDNVLFIDDLNFRSATAFVDIPATTPFQLGIAPNTSSSSMDVFYSMNMLLGQPDTIVIIANGLITNTGYNPFKTFRLDTLMGAREISHDAIDIDLLVANGSTDAPVMDVRAGTETLVNDLAFGSIHRYLRVPFGDHKFRLTNNTGSKTIQTYDLPLLSLTVPGTAGLILTSGFMNPLANNNGPAFNVMFVPASGGPFIPLTTTDPEAYARMQLIHNSPDKSLDTVDVYVDGDKLLDNFTFRTATGFMDVDVAAAKSIGLAPKTSTSVADVIYSQNIQFDSGKRYIVTFDGIKSTSGYSPIVPLAIRSFNAAREEGSNTANTDILMTHGVTDIPTVDIREGTNILADNLIYGNFIPYVSLPANKNYVFTVTNNDGSIEIEKYKGALLADGLQGQALTLLMSGFQSPASNSNGAPWGLYYATALGGPLVPLAISTSIEEVAGNDGLNIWPNPATDKLHIISKEPIATAHIYDITGKLVKTSFKPQGEIDINQLNDGLYLIKLESANTTITHRFIKQ
ncbi:DUF4397 domain-containing protein [Polluticoccus soli]|uniref:T9SS type A sorting domain-containing protein n=1 Tax=Polluticoccus soli TaxID=3034150 RepID=UPI0023E3403F|nr:DUF4397 domain-containing protein [Flavipsychrobacter sp. JY13-12]